MDIPNFICRALCKLSLQFLFSGVIFTALSAAMISTTNAADGELDTAFGSSGTGIVRTSTFASGTEWINSIAIQDDGKIVVAGYSNQYTVGSVNGVIARYTTSGALDTTFGSNGVVVSGSSPTVFRELLITDSGQIIAVGSSGNSSARDFLVSRFNTDGSADNSFGTNGTVTTDLGANNSDAAYGVVLLNDNSIVVAGQSSSASTGVDFSLVKYLQDGSLDTSFGTSGTGKIVLPIRTGNLDDDINNIVLTADDKIIAFGRSDSGVGSYARDFVLARFTSSGAIDTSFGSNGIVITDIGENDSILSAAIQPDGKILVAGVTDSQAGNGINYDIALARYSVAGILDSSFGSGGIASHAISAGNEALYGVHILGDGRFFAGGYTTNSSTTQFALLRFSSNGTLDTTFDGDGIVTTNIGSEALAYGTALQSDGKIILAGWSSNGAQDHKEFALARYLAEPIAFPSINSSSLTSLNIAEPVSTLGNISLFLLFGLLVIYGGWRLRTS